jgi:hypothetical protein
MEVLAEAWGSKPFDLRITPYDKSGADVTASVGFAQVLNLSG